jgi:hypothetical protein
MSATGSAGLRISTAGAGLVMLIVETLTHVYSNGTVALDGLPPGDFPTRIFDVVLKAISITVSSAAARAPPSEADWDSMLAAL